MRRTNDFTGIRGLLAALIGIVLMLAAPALAQARGGAQGTQADTRLIASGTGYSTPHGSARVRAVQHGLIRAGERPGPIDGLYGPLTQEAVERFQAGEGLAVDGIVGPATSSALNEQAVVVSDGAGYAKPGGSTRVRGLQHRLRRAGEHPGPLDGRFGPRTQIAVERFQAGEGLAIDGIIGTATSARLAGFAATSDRTSVSSPQRAGRPSAKPRQAPNSPSTPDHAGAPAHRLTATPSTVSGHGGSEFPAWIVGLVGLGVALLLGGTVARAIARRTDKQEPDPVKSDPDRSFQVRFDGRDSQAVMTAAELLSVAALVEGRDALAFPSFRSGPGGPRVVAFCRIGGQPIRPRQSIGPPDGLIVQDPEIPQLRDLCEALEPGGYLLVNSPRTIEELGLGERVARLRPDRRISIPASEIAQEQIGMPLPDAALVGAFAALSGCVTLESVASSIRERFPGTTGDRDVGAAEAGYRYVQSELRAIGRRSTAIRPTAVSRVAGMRG
ncbi:MAG: peptidoglycan-binding protein [Solirubrobacterales bacterium]